MTSVLENFCTVASEIISEGQSVHLKSKNDVAIRIFGDIFIKGGNINLERAQQLIPGTTDITPENAGDLVAAAGVDVKIKAEVQPKFTKMLTDLEPELDRGNIIVRDKVVRPAGDVSTGSDTSTGTVDTSTNNPTSGDDGLGG